MNSAVVTNQTLITAGQQAQLETATHTTCEPVVWSSMFTRPKVEILRDRLKAELQTEAVSRCTPRSAEFAGGDPLQCPLGGLAHGFVFVGQRVGEKVHGV
jgi:hypothetical protein